tara:strand:- start:273 stop:1103 length:831 start_codon:yes stop_codon:yes gene_type:complete
MSKSNLPGGWRIDLENFGALNRLQGDKIVLAMRGQYKEVAFDPRQVMRVEQQGQQGACAGHSLSSNTEWVHIIATGDPSLQLSRAMGYYETQRIDGINGDSGSTIEGGVQLATTVGICREQLWTYPSGYNNRRPADYSAVIADAAQFKIATTINLKSYDAIRTFLGSGQGGVHLGITWNSSVDRDVVESYSASGGGGHSIGLYSLSDRKDSQGRPYCWMMNSWGASWQGDGWAEWSPRAIEQMLQARWSVFVGLSDMPGVRPRTYALEQLKKDLRV